MFYARYFTSRSQRFLVRSNLTLFLKFTSPFYEKGLKYYLPWNGMFFWFKRDSLNNVVAYCCWLTYALITVSIYNFTFALAFFSLITVFLFLVFVGCGGIQFLQYLFIFLVWVKPFQKGWFHFIFYQYLSRIYWFARS